MSDQTTLACATCGAAFRDGDVFCEQCGARLGDGGGDDGVAAPAEPSPTQEMPVLHPGCRSCGAGPEAIGADGYCTICGVRERPPGAHDELDLGHAAAVTDQGLVHRRNEDAFHLEVVGERGGTAVVCDGVSSASASDAAARHAAAAAGQMLAAALRDSRGDVRDAMIAAIAAARAAVEQTPWTTRVDRDTPSCTLVAALWRAREITIGWIGDSRAYWVSDDGVMQLTTDDSWAEQQIAEGRLSAEEAAKDPRLHSITNWVGADAPVGPPQLASLRAESAGRLILCSDGLWNYLSSAGELGSLVGGLPAGASPASVAGGLTDTALARGGHDNITVAVVDIDPS
jgi:serine/threonine protein phosphatase PrpC